MSFALHNTRLAGLGNCTLQSCTLSLTSFHTGSNHSPVPVTTVLLISHSYHLFHTGAEVPGSELFTHTLLLSLSTHSLDCTHLSDPRTVLGAGKFCDRAHSPCP